MIAHNRYIRGTGCTFTYVNVGVIGISRQYDSFNERACSSFNFASPVCGLLFFFSFLRSGLLKSTQAKYRSAQHEDGNICGCRYSCIFFKGGGPLSPCEISFTIKSRYYPIFDSSHDNPARKIQVSSKCHHTPKKINRQ